MKLTKLTIALMLATLLAACGPLLQRDTVVYGLITDEDGQPVDSVLVTLNGGKAISQLGEVGRIYSNKQGFYEIMADVSHEWWNAHVILPLYSSDNPKVRPYKSYETTRNQIQVSPGDGKVSIGLRTRYDFKLIRK